jgi:hypothetical protein
VDQSGSGPEVREAARLKHLAGREVVFATGCASDGKVMKKGYIGKKSSPAVGERSLEGLIKKEYQLVPWE